MVSRRMRRWVLSGLVLALFLGRPPAWAQAESRPGAVKAQEGASVTNDDPRRADETPPPPPFGPWLEALKEDALKAGVSEATLARALAGIEPDPEVIARDRRQPEFTQTAEEYLAARVSPQRVALGRQMLASHRQLLDRVEEAYGVPARIIVAIWGLETNYGRFTGDWSVIRSLATLAWDRRRSSFFRGELINALKILDAGHISPEAMRGSWAGAMGQSQFMPSSFLRFAEDFDGDGRRDIWGDEADVFASIANYLKQAGWRPGEWWGVAVKLPGDPATLWERVKPTRAPRTCGRALRDHSRRLALAEWRDLGVRPAGSGTFEADPRILASLVQPDGPQGQAYLTYPNFRSILSYNCSNLYGLAVGLLADALAEKTGEG